jgi:hypothetical protein
MPPQKNSGNKGAKSGTTGASLKNRKFVQNFLDDLRADGVVADVHIARIIRKMGNGRMEVFYVDNAKKNTKGAVTQAKIPGKFSGRGKRSVWIDVGTFVAVADSGISGSAEFEIVAVFSPDQMRDISKEFNVDPRILAVDITDAAQLTSKNMQKAELTNGYEFDAVAEEDEEDVDIDDI